ncbi:hypothetical protein [Streptomyces sp. CBMA29]|uniref:hypothetical protein n=1 Tax=Streptomyces sp. CBMA29 TaxID=1896314 RepID=UPI001661BACD|nr:hypothetical protein [Streptomyces sp. CBMA29]MBD0735833.1 hypothetical protein [Streptomyces sp. CBMA29]
MTDTDPLRDAYRALLDAAATVADSGDARRTPPPGEWDGDQILAHVSLVSALTVTAVSHVTSGASATYDNRMAQDSWTLRRVIERAGGNAGLRNRIRLQADALRALSGADPSCGPVLSEDELDTLVPTLLLSNGAVQVDRPVPLRDLVAGLAAQELPGHTAQLLALR